MFSSKFLNTATHYGSGVLAFLAVAYLYDKYKEKELEQEYFQNENIINEFLLNEKFNGAKPFLWIPLVHETNSRMWSSFYGRNSTRLNQPYLEATVASIIHQCGKDFNICIIDDESYKQIVPNWTNDLINVPEPIRTHMRKLAQMKLLYTYGGLIVPPSFLCLESLSGAYNQCKPFVSFQTINRGSSSDLTTYTPSFDFFGSIPNCYQLLEGIHYFEKIVSNNHTDELKFWDEWNRWVREQQIKGRVKVFDGDLIGIKNGNKEITIEEILTEQNGFHLFSRAKYGILLPQNEILTRTSYQWFARMSVKQIQQSDLAVSDYFKLCPL